MVTGHQIAAVLWKAILERLDDGDASVREAACETLHVMLFFLSWEAEEEGQSYESLLCRCLDRFSLDPEAAVREGLEGLVRMVAVVDPKQFLACVHDYMNTHRGKVDEDGFHALLDHGETLLALSSQSSPLGQSHPFHMIKAMDQILCKLKMPELFVHARTSVFTRNSCDHFVLTSLHRNLIE